jgi:predicted dehydrogenase
MAGRVFHAPLISSVEGLELAAVVERHTDQAALRYPGIETYRSLDAMLDDASLGLIVVATPTGSHFEVTRQILEAGKSVVVDKPMAVSSTDIARLIVLANERGGLLAPFHNRRWDGDLRTIKKLLNEGHLGRLVHLESNFDRWRPVPKTGTWREDPAPGSGILLDLGTHLADQALLLFGLPEAVGAEIGRERDGRCQLQDQNSVDSFTLRLRYPGFSVALGGNCLTALLRPRFHLRGTNGNFWKYGLDPQEAALNQITRIHIANWGHEASVHWGTLAVDAGGAMVTRPVEPIPGDYRLFYLGIREALLGNSPPPVTAVEAWRVARLLEWATASSDERREIPCDWSQEPNKSSVS